MKKCIITILILMTSIAAGQASTCVKDLNGDGVIDTNTEKWNCMATEPPICPQGIINCTTAAISLSGTINSVPTNVQDKIGITGISADSQGTSLIVTGWMCDSISCSSGNIGSIKIQNATVSGTVAADKISRMVGTGSDIEVFGCDGGTSCAEQLLGKITVSGANIIGSARADAGLTSIAGNNSTLSVTGMTCSNTVCSQISAGTLSVTGTNAVCPAGSQYQCVDVSGVKKCSPLSCNDDTYGGKVNPGQQICVKDFNNDGTIDFNSEMGICQQYNNKYYCPMQAQDCSVTETTVAPTCPSGGTLNASTKICEAAINTASSCPVSYTLGTDNTCTATPLCAFGSYNVNTDRCEQAANTVYTCSFGGSASTLAACNASCTQIGNCIQGSHQTGPYYCLGNMSGRDAYHGCAGCDNDYGYSCNLSCPSPLALVPNSPYYYPYYKNTCPTGVSLTHWGWYGNGSVNWDGENWDTWGEYYEIFSYYNTNNGWSCSLTGTEYSSPAICAANCTKNQTCTGPTYSCSSGSLSGATCYQAATCPAGGALNTSTNRCETTINTTSSCPAGYTMGAGSICTAAPLCTQGTLNNSTFQCMTGTTTSCPFGAQYECFPNTEKNNVMQCNNIPCIDGSTQGSNPKSSDNSSYHDDGAKDNTGKCLGTLMVFNGKPLECRPSGVNTNFFNCCDQSEGSFLFIKKMCGDPDTECVAKASTGSCHFIGDYCKQEWPLIGCVQHANVFCCFNSMMARIIHEQGRSQLQSFNGWGSVEVPDCRGFTVDEFSHLDFSKIDLSEYVNATKTKMENKIQIVKDKMTQQGVSRIQEKTK